VYAQLAPTIPEPTTITRMAGSFPAPASSHRYGVASAEPQRRAVGVIVF
jgi:hypothetical protein